MKKKGNKKIPIPRPFIILPILHRAPSMTIFKLYICPDYCSLILHLGNKGFCRGVVGVSMLKSVH